MLTPAPCYNWCLFCFFHMFGRWLEKTSRSQGAEAVWSPTCKRYLCPLWHHRRSEWYCRMVWFRTDWETEQEKRKGWMWESTEKQTIARTCFVLLFLEINEEQFLPLKLWLYFRYFSAVRSLRHCNRSNMTIADSEWKPTGPPQSNFLPKQRSMYRTINLWPLLFLCETQNTLHCSLTVLQGHSF